MSDKIGYFTYVQESSVEPDAKNAHPRPIKKQSSRPKVLGIYTCSGLLKLPTVTFNALITLF